MNTVAGRHVVIGDSLAGHSSNTTAADAIDVNWW